MTDSRSNTLGLRPDAGEEVASSFLGGKKGELLKLIAIAAFSALASYYAISTRLAVLENDVNWIKGAITDLKSDVRNSSGARP